MMSDLRNKQVKIVCCGLMTTRKSFGNGQKTILQHCLPIFTAFSQVMDHPS